MNSNEQNEIDISASRTLTFITTAKAVSDYLVDLPLTKEQNDTLVDLMVAHAQAAERSGFYAGCHIREGANRVLS